MTDLQNMAANLGTPAGARRLAESVDELVKEMVEERPSREIVEHGRGELAFVAQAISSIARSVSERVTALKANLGVELKRDA